MLKVYFKNALADNNNKISTHLKCVLCNNVTVSINVKCWTLKFILNNVLIVFCCTLKKYTCFDVLTNKLKYT